MRIEIWSDVVCPWCYIGKRRFERALAAVAEQRDVSSFEIVYRPYQLDPSADPDRTEPAADGYARKFGGAERAAALIANVTATAAEDGLEFRLDRAQRANTKRAHRLLWFAEHQPDGIELQHRLKERLLQAYFTDGDDIGSLDTLVQAATEVGIDAEVTGRGKHLWST
ncbi:MAG TPA: DsbA family oxidoreductase, partial [Ilumatobacteraceae bacterium]|nr:DsbA family oxidoreductase [Ilumatobacteraceae bacterium]